MKQHSSNKLPGQAELYDTSVAGEIWFGGTAVGYNPITALDEGLFTVTFTATAIGTGTLDLDEETDEFSMFPDPALSPVNPSTNIYANDLIDGEVKVVDLPTITPVGYDAHFAVGVTEEFSLDIDNPATGGTYANPQLVFDFPGSGYTLEYLDGTTWVAVTGGVLDLPAMAPGDYTADFLFRVSFDTPGSYTDWSVELYDTDADPGDADGGWLATAELDADVAANFDVTGVFSMQGRTVRSGVPVTLTTTYYGPFSGTTIDKLSNNLTITGVAEATYTVTTDQPRYLNVTADLGKEVDIDGPVTLNSLELKGGNAINTGDSLNKVEYPGCL